MSKQDKEKKEKEKKEKKEKKLKKLKQWPAKIIQDLVLSYQKQITAMLTQ